MFELTERERDVILMRKGGMTFRQIGDEIGRSPERARTIYLAGLRKRRDDKFLRKNWGPLYSYCKKNGISERELNRIINRIYPKFKSFADFYPWDTMVEMDLYSINGVGNKTVQLLYNAYRSAIKIRPIAKPQVDEAF